MRPRRTRERRYVRRDLQEPSRACRLGRVVPRIERGEHARAVLRRAIPTAAKGDADLREAAVARLADGAVDVDERGEVVADGRAIAYPVLPLVRDDGGQTGVDVRLFSWVQGLVLGREAAHEWVRCHVGTWLVDEGRVVRYGAVEGVHHAG